MKKHKKRFIPKHAVQKKSPYPPILPGLSSLNIAKMLSHFMTFRSTVKDLSTSLQRIEKMLDSTYQMFEIAQHVMTKKPSQKLPPPSRRSKSVQENEKIPVINLPPEDELPVDSPLASLLKHFDPQFLFQLLKSPMVQRMLSQFAAQPKRASARSIRKQG